MDKRDIKDFTLEEMKKAVVEIREPGYRAGQIFFWLYKKGVCDFQKMSNLPQAFMSRLEQDYYISALSLSGKLSSSDGTEKFLFNLGDGNFIETVLICARDRKTVCLSTQVGCKFGCVFCASGHGGFIRDLSPSEIINQILFLKDKLKHKITNYVFMGMGEPLNNCDNVLKAIMIMNSKPGMDIGARRITVSTCGVIPGIRRLTDLGLQINLSISLHAATDNLRDTLVPVNRRYPLKELIKASEHFIKKTGRILTLEYVLIKGKNDSLKDADGLEVIARRLKAKVNLIPCSPVPGLGFQPPSKKDIDIFMSRLVQGRIKVTRRESKGKDIQAACGQLAGRLKQTADCEI
ncbi:23S rRNA (adenine(2503)-C(2))-methyltransferase RlmN [bacterium]|nr:23S rRNA (adenine(2503)-C(2))-methyltransferase RlmN [bacterium]